MPQRILDNVETCEEKKNGTKPDVLGFLHYPQFHEWKKKEEKNNFHISFDQVEKVNGLTSTITVAKSNLLGLTCYTLYYYF